MSNSGSNLLRALILAGFALSTSFAASAQSTVFNIPSTDVQSTRRFYVEADFTGHLSSFESGGYQTYGPRIIYGINRRMEVGVNAFYTRTSPAEPVEIQPNFKLKIYDNEDKGLGLAAGTVLFVPVTQRSANTTRAMIYAVGSKSFKGDYGPRFTVGSYALVGSFEPGTSKRGVLLGYEQPINKRLSFIVDWSSGNNDYGYAAVGAGITLSRRGVLYLAYNIGNQGRGNNALGVYYGFSF
ncbi:MAG: hypothetical protein ACXW18_00180 [Pyrinomonadaceae bacterium]